MLRFVVALSWFVAFVVGVSSAHAETINWGTAPQTNLLAGPDNNRPSTPVGVTATTTGTNTGNLTGTALSVFNGTPTGSFYAGVIQMQMDAPAGSQNGSQTVRVTFSEPVYNLSFVVSDIDGGTGYNGFNDYVYFRSSAGFPTTAFPTNAAWVAYSAALGRANAISNQNSTNNTGDITVTFNGPVSWIEVQHENGPDVDNDSSNQWIFVNDFTFRRGPQVRLAKSTNAGSGTFNFTTSNAGTGSTNTSVLANAIAPADNTPFVLLNTINTATTVTETGPAGWLINNGNVTCADSNSAVTGNPATFNGVVTLNSVITIAATNIRAGALITCTVVNQRRASLQVVKISQGATDTFNFTGTNGWVSQNIVTGAVNTGVSGAAQTLTAAAATNLTETALAGWQVNGTPTCTVNGVGSAITWTAATRTIGLTAAQTAAGNVIVCTFTNRRLPRVTVRKTTSGGTGGAFSFAQTGLSAITPLTTSAGNNPASSAVMIGTVGGATSVTEGAMPSSAWLFGSAACIDANAGAAGSGNPTNVGTTAGQAVTLTANMVAGADIICTFTNVAANPQLTLVKDYTPLGNKNVGDVVTFRFTVENTGNVPMTNVVINETSFDGYNGAITPGNEVIVTDNAPTGDTTDGGMNGVWQSIGPGDTIRFTAPYTVVQGDLDFNQ